MQYVFGWSWFFFVLAASSSIVASLLWPLADEPHASKVAICVVLLFAWLGMAWCHRLTARKTPPAVSLQGRHPQFLQRCRQLPAWQHGVFLETASACRVYQTPTQRQLIYLHPHATHFVDMVQLRQLVLLMCRYDCQHLVVCSFAGLTPIAATIAAQIDIEVIDQKQYF